MYNAAPYLTRCLEAIRRLDPPPLECIVVDDGSEDGSAAIAEAAGFPVVSYGGRRGAAFARNFGSCAARGEILLFIDADVEVPPGTAGRVLAGFEEDPARGAVIGSYDDRPGSPAFLSQYRNLLHCYTHQTSSAEASTFWTGCGAVRTGVFRLQGGFSPACSHMEDMELGLRLLRDGGRIRLDKGLTVKHLKHLSFIDLVRMDLFDRAIPWTLLILQYRSMPADLNLKWGQRVSVVAVFLAIAAAAGRSPVECAAALAIVAALNFDFYRFLEPRVGPWFAIRCFPVRLLEFLLSGLGFALGVLGYMARTLLRREPLASAGPDPGPAVEPGANQTL